MTQATRILLSAAFLVAIASVGLIQLGVELGRGDRPLLAELFLRKPTEANLRRYEKDLEDACWVAKKVRPWTQYALFLALKDTGQKAILGRRDWWFYKPGVRYLIEPWPPAAGLRPGQDDPLAAIVSFRDQLAARGVRLLVVPAPGKASVYPEMLTWRARGLTQPVNPHTLSTLARLEESGVEVVNLFKLFAQARAGESPSAGDRPAGHRPGTARAPCEAWSEWSPKRSFGRVGRAPAAGLYLAQDTHWSPQAVRLAAEAVAGKILDLRWVEPGDAPYELRPVTIRRQGDLLAMLDVPQLERHYPPEQTDCMQVVRGDTGQPYRDDAESEVLVLGDSFLRIYQEDEPGSAGFIAHLAERLKRPLASIVNDGGASTLVRQQLSRKPALLANKSVVIWEFAERDLRFGTEGWQEVELP